MLIYNNMGIDEEMLKRINDVADKVIREKRRVNIDYELLEKILRKRLNETVRRNSSNIEIVIPIKKEIMIKTALDFLKSLDEEFYKKATALILQEDNKIKMNIYNKHKIKEYGQEDEFGVREFTETGEVDTYRGRANINIPIEGQLKKGKEEILEENTGTLKDLYILVHEITHLFDFDITKTSPKKEELLGKKSKYIHSLVRDMLCETTTFMFEDLLTDYLLKEGVYSKDAIKQENNRRINSSIGDSRLVYTQLLLAKEKEKNGVITKDSVERLMRENNISPMQVQKIAMQLVNNKDSMLFRNRYALAGIIEPTKEKKYNDDKEDGIKVIKQYLKETKEDNLEGVFEILGIEKNENGINELIKNMKERESDNDIER